MYSFQYSINTINLFPIGAGRKEHGLYVLEYLHLPLSAFPAISLSATSELWHHRLGHLSDARLRTLSTSGVLGNISSISSNKCETCRFAKQIATSFSSSDHVSNACFDLVHFDVWGPSLFHPSLGMPIIFVLLMTFHAILGYI